LVHFQRYYHAFMCVTESRLFDAVPRTGFDCHC